MKFAFIFSGQFRNWHLYQYDLDYWVNLYKPDIFIHSWTEADNYVSQWDRVSNRPVKEIDFKDFENKYKPKKKQFDSPLNKTNKDLAEDWNFGQYELNIHLDRFNSMIYSRWKSFSLLESYENEQKFKYDYILLLRTDTRIKPENDFPLSNKLILPRGRITSAIVSDVFCLGPRDLVKTYCELYCEMPNFYREIPANVSVLFPELIYSLYLNLKKIEINFSENTTYIVRSADIRINIGFSNQEKIIKLLSNFLKKNDTFSNTYYTESTIQEIQEIFIKQGIEISYQAIEYGYLFKRNYIYNLLFSIVCVFKLFTYEKKELLQFGQLIFPFIKFNLREIFTTIK